MLAPIRQTEKSECGLACLCMVANYHGIDANLASLRARFDLAGTGVTLRGLKNIAEALGFVCEARRIELQHLHQISVPVILHWKLDHFVVLEAVSARKLSIIDPAVGAHVVTWDEADQCFSGVVLTLEPSVTFDRAKASVNLQTKRLRVWDLWPHGAGLRKNLWLVLLTTLLMQVTGVVTPLFMQVLVDRVLPSGSIGLLLAVAIAFGAIAFIGASTEWLRALVVQRFGVGITKAIARNLVHHLLTLPLRFFERRHPGSLLSQFVSIDAVQRALTNGMLEAIIDAILVATLLVTIWIYEWRLACVAVLVMALLTLIRVLTFGRFHRLSHKFLDDSAAAQSRLIEAIGSISSIKSMGIEAQQEAVFRASHERALASVLALTESEIHVRFAQSVLNGIGGVIVTGCGVLLVLNGELTIGMLLAFIGFQTQCTSSLTNLVAKLQALRLLDVHLERMSDIAHAESEKHMLGSLTAQYPSDRGLAVALENVTFRYGANLELILNGVNFSIQVGESIGILGVTGAGKTTLLKVILGLEDPTGGRITFDGGEFSVLGKKSVRSQTGVVLQDNALFDASILDNITAFDPAPDLRWVDKLCTLVLLDKDLKRFPMGLSTMVGPSSKVVSEGQKQKIAIARALYRKPRLLILDEATAHLDNDTESQLTRGIASLGMTRIFVTHRHGLLAATDKVLELVDGRLIESSRIGEVRALSRVAARDARDRMAPIQDGQN